MDVVVSAADATFIVDPKNREETDIHIHNSNDKTCFKCCFMLALLS